MPTCQEAHPEWCSEVSWDVLGWDLLGFPALVQCGLLVLLIPVRTCWNASLRTSFIKKVRSIVGEDDLDNVQYPWIVKFICVLEIICALWFFVGWTIRQYSHSVSKTQYLVDQILSGFLIGDYIINVPVFTRPYGGSPMWFNFNYLRAINAIHGVTKLDHMGALKQMGDMHRMFLVLTCRIFALVTWLVGTTMNLEIIGDPEFLEDTFTETNMGSLSVIQMTYWIFTTISTVGYGFFFQRPCFLGSSSYLQSLLEWSTA
ncbi:unnamed protein product [Polarella glacialis]|uniref:Uncharacterized protein n=1 Tax=Polarella glacialis TaxID=89957 RepID=A0A813LJ97_POLGL|nr:unnamed protein product [Polarella glacialis]